MRLHEEYILRNNLDVPVIRYEPSRVFLQRSSNWAHGDDVQEHIELAVFKIDVRSEGWYSSVRSFYFSTHRPIHNGSQRISEKYFEPLLKDDETPVPLDRYDYAISTYVEWAKFSKWRVVPQKEAVLTAWYMFLICHDKWIAKETHQDIREMISQSLPPNDYLTKSTAFRNVRRLMEIHHRRQSDTLRSQFLPMANGHSKWLEKLINDS